MFEALINRYPKVWIKHQDFVQEINRFLPSPGIHCIQVDSVRFGKSIQVLECFLIGHITLILLVRRSDHLENDSQLVVLREGETRTLFLHMLVRGEREA